MPQYAILRFEKHKSGSCRALEAHHERQKEKYASNPNIILKRASTIFISFSQQNITVWKWMNESKRQGAEHAKTAQCLSTHS